MLKNNLAFLLVISLVSQMALQQNVYAVPMESVVSENTYEDESQIQDAAVLVDSSEMGIDEVVNAILHVYRQKVQA